MMNLARFSLLMAFLLMAGQVSAQHSEAAPGAPNTSIEGFDAQSAEVGWVLLGQRLYHTRNAGEAWTDITPEVGEWSIQALEFVDEQYGWLAFVGAEVEGEPAYALVRTRDGGATWATLSLNPFQPGAPEAYAEKVFLHFIDSQTGWLVIKQATSRNFSHGTLFQTNDGGETWTRLTLPLGEPVYFESAQVGWVQGGVTGDERYRTEDGGATWQAASPDQHPPLPPAPWTLIIKGGCVAESHTDLTCTTAQQLQRMDGRLLTLPTGHLTAIQTTSALAMSAPASVVNGAVTRWQAATGQGFDSCTLPSLTQMQDWMTNSPYRVWNLYIGGSARAPCGTLTASHLAALAVQGWRFIPTWVGPQAACYPYPISRMSGDPAVAYQQGIAEANAAVDRAAALGLTFSDDSGTVIYYDLEAYPNDANCRAAAQAFMNGWVQRVRERGNIAGVYGTTCTSYLSDFVANPYVPDAIWAAVWLLPYQYRSSVSVSDLPCLSNSLWVNDQRLRQYAGGHNETWGATTINIDSDALDGPVADLRDPAPLAQAAEFYRDFDFADASACSLNQTGWFNAEECGAGWNDELSSLRLRLGWSARVFRDTNLNGPSFCYVLSDPDLSNDFFAGGTTVENNISSVKVYDNANANCADYITYLPAVFR